MPILPTSRTIPQTKDIAQVSALPLRVGSQARQDLDSVLVAVDSALDTEAVARQNADNTISANLAAHIASTTAHPASSITAVSQERGAVVASALRPIDSFASINNNNLNTFGQRFTSLVTSTLNSIRLDLRKIGSPTGSVSVDVYTNSAGVPGSLLASSGSVSVASIRQEPGYLTEFTFSTPASLTASTDYVLVINSSAVSLADSANYIQVGSDSSASYGKFAVASTNGGSTWSVQTYALFMQANSAPATKVQDYLDNLVAEYRNADIVEAAERFSQDSLINSRIDTEIAQLRATANNPNNKVVNIASSIATRPDGTQLRLPNGSLLTDFTGGSINFATGAVTGSVGSFSRINFSGQAGKWAKYSLILLPTQPDAVLVVPGINYYASLSAAQNDTSDPSVSGGIPIAIICVQDNGSGGTGTINDIAQSHIMQVRASGSGSGGSGSGSPLDPDQESNYAFYARSDFSVDKKLFYGSISGSAVDQILGLGRISFTGNGIFNSSNLVGEQQRQEANVINRATVKLRYDSNFKDPAPIVSLSRNGGITYQTATLSNPASSTELWLADATWSSQESGQNTTTATPISDRMISTSFSPAYDQVVTSFAVYMRTASSSGTITAYIRNTASGGIIPTTVVAQSAVVLNCGADIVNTFAYFTFPISAVTLKAGTTYALTVEGSSGVTISSVLGSTSLSNSLGFVFDGAVNSGSGWSGNPSGIPVIVNSAGTDLRLRVQSSVPTTEHRLLGFGVDFVLVGPATVSGMFGQEARTITATEASTGIVTFSSLTYVPGARQLYAKSLGHLYMGPEDFVELAPNQIQFTPGFFIAGQVVVFFVAYGLVDGTSSESLPKINALEEIIVGTPAQVSAGMAGYSNLQGAISIASPGQRIALLRGVFTGPITIDREVHIYGRGRGSEISGTITISSTGGGTSIKNCRLNGNTSIDTLAKNVVVCDNWVAPTFNVSGGTNSFILNLGEVV
jgi:hypothetical protein